ncbi:proline-rich transmembrane protein 1 [Oryzias melastigma]|uniref:proline-rich transmembrane protein 1 n=1 Tax=Oryzias melastigma TaxID=30732 RepID=UPI000CF811BE|nr:proline-rich transmembrane protein 1 [Oryzias melastigma]
MELGDRRPFTWKISLLMKDTPCAAQFPNSLTTAFGNPPQCAGRGYDPPGFVTSANSSRAQRNPVKDYLGFSVFTMLCCCLPFGIFALIQSIIAREANFYQDWMRAERKSRNAKILNCVALGMGILILIPASGFLVYNLIIDDNDD